MYINRYFNRFIIVGKDKNDSLYYGRKINNHWFWDADVSFFKKEEAIEGFNFLKKNPFYVRNDSNDTYSRFDLLDYTITIEKVQVNFTNKFD